MLTFLPVIRWLFLTPPGAMMRDIVWAFPVVEMVHLLGLVMLLGSILVMDLRLLGFGMRERSIADLAEALHPWMGIGLGVMVVTGILLFLSGALRYCASGPFFVKMILFALAVLFHFTIYRKLVTVGSTSDFRPGAKLAAYVSLALWFGVGLAGRAIAFVG